MNLAAEAWRSSDYFLRAEPRRLGGWLERKDSRAIRFCIVAIIAGGASYGAVIGCWRGPLQSFYAAVKLPLVILLTALGNGLLNGMMAPLLGLGISFRNCLAAVLVSFAYASAVLAGFSPVALFVVWNVPPLTPRTPSAAPEYCVLQLALAFPIALAGVIGNVRLLPLLQQLGGNCSAAMRVMCAWLVGNLFLGSQICWVLRPFIWGFGRPVEFTSSEAFKGNLFETVYLAIRHLLG